jgi:hypothetical protein
VKVVISAPPPSRTYLRRLESCFPEWEGAAASRWYFERRLGGPPTDLVTLREGARMVAGVAVSYRPLRLANDGPVLAAMMSAGWTLPAVRGQGLLTHLAGHVVPGLASRRGAALVLGFMTEDNPSGAALASAGYARWPTRYVTRDPAPAGFPPLDHEPTPPSPQVLDELGARYRLGGVGSVRPVYPDATAFASQFLGRPGPCELLRLAADGRTVGWAAIERVESTDRIQLLLAEPEHREACLRTILARAASRDRRVFAYSTDPRLDDLWRALDLRVLPGRVMLRSAPGARLARALAVPSEEPQSSDLLVDPTDRWYLGPWHLQCGDRL